MAYRITARGPSCVRNSSEASYLQQRTIISAGCNSLLLSIGPPQPYHAAGVLVCAFLLRQCVRVISIFGAQLSLLSAVQDPLWTDHLDTCVPLGPLTLGLSKQELLGVRGGVLCGSEGRCAVWE